MIGQRNTHGLVWLLVSVLQLCRGQDFGYEGDHGPSHWGEQYNTCFGKHQSPINIDSLSVTRTVLPPLRMQGFESIPDKTELSNNGHTVMLSLDAEVQPSISGGPLHGEYVFNQLHFHWGENDTMGSEDSIDGVSYPMELHMVFYKKMYRNSRDALEHADGLTVLAFFYELSEKNNEHYDAFTDILDNITDPGNKASFINPPTLRELLPEDLVHYFTYNGSLTTPPCSEVVTWIDFKQPVQLSHEQINKFRAVQDSHGQHLTHNFRPIQPLGDRIVLFNIDSEEDNTLEQVEKDEDAVLPEAPVDVDVDTKTKPAAGNDDEEDDVGVGSVHRNHLGGSPRNDDLDMMSDMPILANNDLDEKRPHNPKLDAAKLKGKGNSAGGLCIAHTFLALSAALVLWS